MTPPAVDPAAPERRVVYLVATSVDGFIAAEDGSIDAFRPAPGFLEALFARFPETCPAHLRGRLGVEGPNRRFDAAIMSRATYAPALDLGIADPYPTLRTVVVSRTLAESKSPVHVAGGELADLVATLRREAEGDIWLAGGGTLAAAFRDLGLIDELVLKVNPMALGRGIPLFAGPAATTDFELIDAEPLPGGVQLLRYRVVR